MPLPPVVQAFSVQAGEFLAGIDDMIAGTDRLAGSLDAAAAAAERVSGVFDATASADERLAGIEAAVSEQTDMLVKSLNELAMFMDENVVATREAAASLDLMAASADRAAAGAAAAGTAAEGAGVKTAASGAAMKTALLGVGIAAIYGIDKAAKFQASMTQLHTQAGVAQSKLAGLSQGVLRLAGQVGEGPQSLSESLYHVASNMASLGASGPTMLNAVRVAAEGAQVGGADLVDVTNALTAAIASGIPGVSNFSQAMGALNATVGSGDMHMQDLADAFSTGLLATVKGYGLSLKDVGAALAVFGDNNIRGAKAGTDLRMAVQALAVPVKTGQDLLKSWGVNADQLAKDMSSGGLMKALDDLTGQFRKNGVTAKNEGEVITTLFGKKAGSGIAVLLEQMDRLKSKYPDITKSANGFADAWQTRQQTMAQQWDNLKSGAQALAISFGQLLLPAATKFVAVLAKVVNFFEQHPAIAKFAGALLAVFVAMKLVSSIESSFQQAEAAFTNPWVLGAIAAIALAAALYELYRHSKLVRDVVADIGKFFKAAWNDAMKGADAVIKWFVSGPLKFIQQQIAQFSKWWSQNGKEISQAASDVWHLVASIVTTEWRAIWDLVLRPGLTFLEAAWKTAWGIAVDTVKLVWNTIAAIIRAGQKIIEDVIVLVADLITGRWGKAWHDAGTLVSDAIRGIGNILRTFASGALTLLVEAGRNIVLGLIHGIESMAGAALSAVEHLGSSLLHGAMSVLGIHSPSVEFYKLGGWITQGLANGVNATAQQAVAASRRLAAAIRSAYYSGQITAGEAAELQSKLSTALGSAERAIESRRASLAKTMQRISLEIRAGLLAGLENASSASAAKTAVNKLISYVREAWQAGDITGGRASSLTDWLERDNSRLQSLAAQRQSIAATIKTAQAYAVSTTSNTEQWAGLSNVASSMASGGMVYSGNLLAGMQANLASIKAFGAAITKLGKLGLRKDLIDQIIQMGPDQGLQVANALIQGPLSVIQSVNTTQAQIVSGSTSLGQAAADAMYDSGAQAGKGFLSGLQAQEKSITAMMDRLANSMVSTVKKALKIHSPSQVMAEHGSMVALGLAQGIEGGVPVVQSAALKMARAAVPAQGTAGTGQSGGNTAPVVNVHVTVNGFVGNNQQLASEIYQMLQTAALRHNRRNGLNGLSLAFG